MAQGNWTESQKEYAAHVMTHVEVHGLTELVRAFGKLDKSVKRELQKELRKIAEPAAEKAREKARALGLSLQTVTGIRPGSRMGMAVVRQRRRRTTGLHPQFGPLQMEHVLQPAAVETMPIAKQRLEEMLDRIADEFNYLGS